jgi:pyridoxamine 5'-phosphate oxidase
LAAWFWAAAAAAVGNAADPWRLPVLATVGDRGPEARVVVLRAADATEARLTAFTDSRSRKAVQAAADGRVAWVFWNPATRVQARVRTHATVLVSAHETEPWRNGISEFQLDAYRGEVAPGRAIPGGAVVNPTGGPVHFAVLQGAAVEIDLLELGPAGHRRALLTRIGDGWSARWIAA